MSITRRKALIAAVGGVVLPKRLKAQPSWAGFMVNSSNRGWKFIPIGAGGFISGISIGNDNTAAVNTDTYGAYVWDDSLRSPVGTSGSWRQVCTSSSLGSTGFQFLTNSDGSSKPTYDIRVSWSSPNIVYMIFNDVVDADMFGDINQAVYKSTDRGKTWAKQTNFTAINIAGPNFWNGSTAINGFAVKTWNQRLVIDPTDSNKVYFGTGVNGLWQTTDGGSTWTNISSGTVPFATANNDGSYPGYALAIGVLSGTQYVLAYGFKPGGTGFVYLSTAGAWSNVTTGSPVATASLVKIVFNNGNFYCLGSDGKVYKYTASSTQTWSTIYSTGDGLSIAADPNVNDHIVLANNSAALAESTNGTSFGSFSNSSSLPTTTGDIPWLAQFFNSSMIALAFNANTNTPVNTVKMWGTNNGGVFTISWTQGSLSGSAITWQAQSRGIEQIVGNVIIAPTSNNPICGGWDSGLYSGLNLSAYVQAVVGGGNIVPYAWNGPATTLGACWSLDYAKDGSGLVVALIAGAGIDGSTQLSSFSTNNGGGGASWASFSTPASGTSDAGGCVAVSTSSKVMYCPAGVAPSYTTNFGASPTWTQTSLENVNVMDLKTISSASYVSATGVVTINLSSSSACTTGAIAYVNGITVSGGSDPGVNGKKTLTRVTGTQFIYTTNSGFGLITLSTGTVSGWGFMPQQGQRLLISDGLTSGTYYLAVITNSASDALYVSTDNGATWSALSGGSLSGASPSITSIQNMKATPGVAADFWLITTGGTGGALYRYRGGVLTNISNIGGPINSCYAFGFGTSGGSYPSVYIASGIGGAGGSYGIWRSDNASSGATPTWNLVGNVNYPNMPQCLGMIEHVRDVSGDPGIVGRCYVATGDGFLYFTG